MKKVQSTISIDSLNYYVDGNPDVPRSINERMPWWIRSSRSLKFLEYPWIIIMIQDLMTTEVFLLEMEKHLSDNFTPEGFLPDHRYPAYLTQWIFAFYEMIRTTWQLSRPKTTSEDTSVNLKLLSIKRKIEILRVPLAKHEFKGAIEPHYPSPIVFSEEHQFGWIVQDGKSRDYFAFSRIYLADEFLSAFGRALN